MPEAPAPIRVAIVGGGCSALTTAMELTRPELANRYEVTVYQMGFRLGGKGASGRGVEGRIEEHGLHLWMGFYENAFRLMREAYAECNRDRFRCPIATWQEAFEPAPDVAVTDLLPNGTWDSWIAHFPPGKGLPGDPIADGAPFTVRRYLEQAISLVIELLQSAQRLVGETAANTVSNAAWSTPEGLVAAAEKLIRLGHLATVTAIFEAADVLRGMMTTLMPQAYGSGGTALPLVDAIASAAKHQIQMLVSGDHALRRIWQVIDLILAILRGSFLFGLALDPRGFDAINDYDWRQWLRMCGASEASLDTGFVRGIYDLVFAYEDGDVQRPSLAAGVALRGAMRMFFTYRGSLFYRMTAGMGDIVFAPLYEVLVKRGVKFAFFHRLKAVTLGKGPSDVRPHLETLTFDVQATVIDGKSYKPLVEVHGVPCWPSLADYSQLENGSAIAQAGWAFESPWETRVAGEKTLHVGQDFDFVVMGVPVAAWPYACQGLIDAVPRFGEMVRNVKTVATQSFQIWMRKSMEELGWNHGPVNLSGFVEPFDTWADMRHLIAAERWNKPISSIAYFCSVLPDAMPVGVVRDEAFHHAKRVEVRNNAVRFLEQNIGALWPQAINTQGKFRWNALATPRDGLPEDFPPTGPARFDKQFWMANVNPSERYSLSLPGTIKYRISPLELLVDNMTIAGDWTASGLDSGCVESAVMSGLLAAHSIAQTPALENIIGYDHP